LPRHPSVGHPTRHCEGMCTRRGLVGSRVQTDPGTGPRPHWGSEKQRRSRSGACAREQGSSTSDNSWSGYCRRAKLLLGRPPHQGKGRGSIACSRQSQCHYPPAVARRRKVPSAATHGAAPPRHRGWNLFQASWTQMLWWFNCADVWPNSSVGRSSPKRGKDSHWPGAMPVM